MEGHTKGGYIAGIDGLRAIAVVAVLLFHAFPTAVPGGFIGVDVFFVISGFIITKTYFLGLRDRQLTIGQFFVKRVRRLAPIYVLVLLLTVVASLVVLTPIHLKDFATSLLAQPFYMQNVVFWAQGDYFALALTRPLLHTWSLAVEEQFYIVYAIYIVVVRRFPRAAIPLLVAIGLLSYGVGHVLYSVSPKTVFYWLPPRMWELGLGVLCALWSPRISRAVGTGLGIAGVVLVVFAIARFDERAALPGVQSLSACFGTAAALIGVSGEHVEAERERNVPARLLGHPVMAWIGKLSYSLYMWHWPIIALVSTYVGRSLGVLGGGGALAATVVLSYVGLEWWEKPVRQRRFFHRDKVLLGAAAASAVVVLAVAGIFLKTNGATFRYPPEIAKLYLAQAERLPFRCGRVARLAEPQSEVCAIDDVAPATDNVLLLGDSHADVLKQALGEVASARGYGAFLTKRDCKLQDFGHTPQCGDSVLEQIERDIVSHHVRYVFAMAFIKRGEALDPALELAAARLSERVDHVFVMQVVPNDVYFDPAERARALERHQPLPKPYTLEDYARDNASQLHGLQRIATAHPKITILDPTPYLCDTKGNGACDFDTDGTPIYFDAHHLSPTGAKLLRPLFTNALGSRPD